MQLSSKLGGAPVVPDPIELQKRIDEDKFTILYLQHIEDFKAKDAGRRKEKLRQIELLKQSNAEMSKERTNLLNIMNRNDSKIRILLESTTDEQTRDPHFLRLKRQISIRRRIVKQRYVSELLLKRRDEFNKALSRNPVVPPQVIPTIVDPTEPTP